MKQWYIAIGVAIVYLAISMAFKAWSWSWILWVAYAAYRFTESRKSHGKIDICEDLWYESNI